MYSLKISNQQIYDKKLSPDAEKVFNGEISFELREPFIFRFPTLNGHLYTIMVNGLAKIKTQSENPQNTWENIWEKVKEFNMM